MKPLIAIFAFLLMGITSFSQNIKSEQQSVSFYRYPLKPLDKSVKTYSGSLVEQGSYLRPWLRDSLLAALTIPGLQKTKNNSDVQLELIIGQLVIISKQERDKPLEYEKDGKKTVLHQYWYDISYSFPAKLKVLYQGNVVSETDLSIFSSTKYYPKDNTSLTSLQNEYERDSQFKDKLIYECIEKQTLAIRTWLFSNHGYGWNYEYFQIGYIKDKKGEYADLTKAFTLLNQAFTYADKNPDHLDDTFKQKVNEAIVIYENTLKESSSDKKARVNLKVTAMIQYNLALAHYGLNDFNKAEDWLQKAQKNGYEGTYIVRNLKELIQDKLTRLTTNGMI